MKRLLPAFPVLSFSTLVWLQAHFVPSPSAALVGDYTFGSSSEWKFWGTTAGIVLVLGIVSALFRNHAKAWISGPFGQHTLIVIGLLVVVVFASHIVGTEGYRESREWSRTLDPNFEDSVSPYEQLTITAKLSDGTQQRLREQYREIRGRARHHLKVMAYFFTNYYRAIQMIALLGAIAAVALFFVAFKGWTSTNQYVRNLFITATVLTAYFSLYPTVFKQQDNITDNKNLYLEYVAIQDDVRTFAATGQSFLGAEGTAKTNEADFLHNIDQRMSTLNNIAIGFDYTKVSYKDIFSSVKPSANINRQQGAPNAEAEDKKKNDGK
jgi:ABC-type multidrug transport system fused ATPase/permease subunit